MKSWKTRSFIPVVHPANGAWRQSRPLGCTKSYIGEVKDSTEVVLESLSFDDIKKKISDEAKENLRSLHVVSEDENAVWLIDYWCNKDIRGLIQMPFSRHWIMHLEACLRIKSKIHT